MRERIKALCIGIGGAAEESLANQQRAEWDLQEAASWWQCLKQLAEEKHDILVTGTDLDDIAVDRLIEEALRLCPTLTVVVLARQPDYSEAARLARLGADDYLPLPPETPFSADEVVGGITRAHENNLLRTSPGQGEVSEAAAELVGRSKAIGSVNRLIKLIAPRQSTVLITGRTGTGKELVARAIHAASPRAARPLVVVNCGAIPEHLIEAELFGHVKGAFTGAISHRVGRFEQAHGGVIFLDEVGEMPLEMQSKQLRVLQEREFQRVGSSETIKVDVRVVAATNCDLKELVQQGKFREDLYYRLNVVPMSLPSLAERVEDLPSLVQHLLAKICRQEGLPLVRVAPETVIRLMEYSWPGNVRQLENAIEKAVALSGDRQILYPSDFPLPAPAAGTAPAVAPDVRLPDEGIDFDSVVGLFERSLLEQALERTGGNKKRAAELLRIKRTTFAAKLRASSRDGRARMAGEEVFPGSAGRQDFGR